MHVFETLALFTPQDEASTGPVSKAPPVRTGQGSRNRFAAAIDS